MLTNFFKTQIAKKDFRERMQFLLEKFSGKKIIIFGIGKELEVLLNEYNFKKLNIIALCDNKIQESNEFCEIKIILPQQIKDYDYDFIFIAQDNLFRAQKFLVEDLNIDSEKIVNILRTEIPDENVNTKYLKSINYKRQFKKIAAKMRNKKVIIYGANSLLSAINKLCDLSKLNILFLLKTYI